MSQTRQNSSRPIDPLAELNDPEAVFRDPGQLQFMRTLVNTIRRVFSAMIRYDQAAPQIILTSPNGTAYIVTVGDDGVLTARTARG